MIIESMRPQKYTSPFLQKLLDEITPADQERTTRIMLLELYSHFLEDEGYTDIDWRAEHPTAIDKFIQQYPKLFKL